MIQCAQPLRKRGVGLWRPKYEDFDQAISGPVLESAPGIQGVQLGQSLCHSAKILGRPSQSLQGPKKIGEMFAAKRTTVSAKQAGDRMIIFLKAVVDGTEEGAGGGFRKKL